MPATETSTIFDLTRLDHRIAAAALELAKERDWNDISLLDIASAADIPLAEFQGQVASKSDVLLALARALDTAMLVKAPRGAEMAELPRDRLFDIIMIRLELLQPYRQGLRNILTPANTTMDPRFLTSLIGTQRWLLNAAGLDSEGGRGAIRMLGLASLYSGIVRVWLDDNDPGLSRTMATLDRRLRRGERWMSGLDELAMGARRLFGFARKSAQAAGDQWSARRQGRRGESWPEDEFSPASGTDFDDQPARSSAPDEGTPPTGGNGDGPGFTRH